jgi:hypothetical protein
LQPLGFGGNSYRAAPAVPPPRRNHRCQTFPHLPVAPARSGQEGGIVVIFYPNRLKKSVADPFSTLGKSAAAK